MRLFYFAAWIILTPGAFGVFAAVNAQPPSVDEVLNLYRKALGGSEKVDRLQTLEVRGTLHRSKVIYYWQKPNQVLQILKGAKVGYDGGGGWQLSAKKHVMRLPKGEETAIQMNADPLRYAHLHDLFHDLEPAPTATLDGRVMHVLVAPNNVGSTKFYFDAQTHLLSRIEEFGVTSAYYKHITDFEGYKDFDGLRFPSYVTHQTDEPGVGTSEFHVSKVKQNIGLDPQIFKRPNVAPVVLGGKR